MKLLRVLCLGDIVGRPGRRAVAALLPDLRRRHRVDITIANVENAAGGFGITQDVAEELHACGIDVMTSGNHIWDKREAYPFLDSCSYLVRPANYPEGAPGRGVLLYDLGRLSVAVINLAGRAFMDPLDCPFRTAKALIQDLRSSTKVIIVDFHAEATAEKVALGWYLDGLVTAVVGTHTHVPTADCRVLPRGTGYVTDLGMSGPRDSVLGMEVERVLERFLTQLPVRFEVADGPAVLSGVLLEIDSQSGKCHRIIPVAAEHPMER